MTTAANKTYRDLFIGLEVETPLLDGTLRRYINLDNAASTPAFKAVQQAVDDFLIYYSSVHRGAGFKSQLSTHVYEQARQIALRFVNADPEEHTCIFGKNTTEAINKLANRFPFTARRDTVLTSLMEHHSNDLPWRAVADTIHVSVTADGQLDEMDFDEKLERYGDRLALVAISGASNVTGFMNPIHSLAKKTHAAGGRIAVDCAQLAPHRRVNMGSVSDPAHLDYITISAHKMYAPFGSGALIGRKDTFEQGEPDLRGGGTVEIVTVDDVTWSGPPDKDEAGSPNVVGVVALGTALSQFETIGMQAVAEHEAKLTAFALQRLQEVPGIRLFGSTEPARAGERLGSIPLVVDNVPHFLAAAILGYEYSIGVRSGCFCAHPYILHLLGLSRQEALEVRNRMKNGDKSEMPGLIRASFGLYNTIEEIDSFAVALSRITKGEFKGIYKQDTASGEYTPEGWRPDFEKYFSFL